MDFQWRSWNWKFIAMWIGSIATAVIATVAVLDFLERPSGTPNASIIPRPPSIVDEAKYYRSSFPGEYLRRIYNIANPAWLEKNLEWEKIFVEVPEEEAKKITKDIIIKQLKKAYEKTMPISFIPEYWNEYRIAGYWDVDIRNNTQETLYDVELETPSGSLTAIISKPGTLFEVLEEGEKIGFAQLGEMRPQEEFDLRFWVYDAFFLSKDEFNISHRNGTGKINVIKDNDE